MSDIAETLAVQFRNELGALQDESAKRSARERLHRIVDGYLSDDEIAPHEAARINAIIDGTNAEINQSMSQVA